MPDNPGKPVGDQRRPHIMNTQTSKAVVVADGFDAIAQDLTACPVRGINAKFKEGD
jgi:hypothetical protein